MSRAAGRFATLAGLQQLVQLERRRAVEVACAEADRCAASARDLASGMAQAEEDHAAAHAGPHLCLSRLTIAASIVTASEAAARRGEVALTAARAAAEAAGAAWLRSRFRRDWFVDRDREERHREDARRADRADAEARLRRHCQGQER